MKTLAELSNVELLDFVEAIREVQCRLSSSHRATGFNLAILEGAGASMELLHCHVVPRVEGDLEDTDAIYGMIDHWSPKRGHTNTPPPVEIPDEADRTPRSEDQMRIEAEGYARLGAEKAELGILRRSGALPLPSDRMPFGPKIKLFCDGFFYATEFSLAFVNLKPIMDGHVLVTSRRVVPWMQELTVVEIEDLWGAVRVVQAIVMEYHGCTSCNIGVQEGPHAGQSVPHVHVHIIPR